MQLKDFRFCFVLLTSFHNRLSIKIQSQKYKKLVIAVLLFFFTWYILHENSTRLGVEILSKSFGNESPQLGSFNCSKWAVTASADKEPSEAIRRFLYDTSWCLIVVLLHSNHDYKIPTSIGKNIIVLDEEEQKKIQSNFIDSLPRTIAARRNAGYLFAIAHGARIIFDFDEYVELKFWVKDAGPEEAKITLNDHVSINDSRFERTKSTNGKEDNCILTDPSQLLTTNVLLQNNCTFKKVPELNKAEVHYPVGLLISVVDKWSDIATYKEPKKLSKSNFAGILLSEGDYFRVNERSLIYFYEGFWAMYEPSEGKLCSVKKSFITKALFEILHIYAGFTRRSLTWMRKKHYKVMQHDDETKTLSILNDVKFFKKTLIISEYDDMSDLVENFWSFMAQKGHILYLDLSGLQNWLNALRSVNYRFPQLKKERGSSKLPLGNLNFKNVGKQINTLKVRSECEDLKNFPRKTLWTSDLHGGTRADMASIFSYLHQTIWISGIKGRSSHYPKIFNMPGVKVSSNLSPTLKKYNDHSTPLSNSKLKAHVYYYSKNHQDIDTVDGFICSFPASMCELWMPFNKTIFFIPAHRYNLGRCSLKAWHLLNNRLKHIEKGKKFIGAISRYDLEYMDHYTNIPAKLYQSHGGLYLENSTYSPISKDVLYFGESTSFFEELNELNSGDLKIKNAGLFQNHYTIEGLTRSKAIIFIAYSVMSYKLTEFYYLAIPLFMPSLKYYRKNKFGHDRTSTTAPYCQTDRNLKYFPPHPSSAHPYNPNIELSDSVEAEMYWLQYADFFDWPHIQHFDSAEHLIQLLIETNFTQISIDMKTENSIKKIKTMNAFCTSIKAMNN